MALSGSIEGSIHSGHYKLRISWSATQNIGNNTSTITAKMYLVQDPSWSLNIKTRSNSCSIAGVSTAFTSPAISSNGGSTILLGTVSRTVNHAADGTRNVAISATFNIQATISGTRYESISASGTVTLDTIARVSGFTLSASSVVLGNTIGITINRLSSSFTHRIKYIWGQKTGTIATGVTTSHQWTVPLDFANDIPHGTSGTCHVIVETMNGSTVIGSVTKTFTGTVPTNIVPSISSVTISDPSGTVPTSIGLYVKGKSTLRVVTEASGSYGSTISSYNVLANGVNHSGKDVTTGVIDVTGTLSIVVTVTDTRGRTASMTKNITVYDYHTPIISTFDVKRVDASGNDDNDGTYARISYTTILAPVGNKNRGSMAIYYKASNEVNWITAAYEEDIPTAISDSFTISNVSIDNTYDVRIDLADSFVGSSRSAQLPTAAVVLDFLADGTGLGVGKVAEYQNMLDVAWAARFRREIIADAGITSMGNRMFPTVGITVHRNTSNQNLTASDAYEVVKWTHATTVGSGLSLNSAGGIVIGEGVSVVRVSGQITCGAQINGMKVAAIWTSTSNAHLSRTQAYVNTANPQTINFAPKLVNVSQGNVLTVRVYGASGDVVYGGSMQSYFTVEAVG
jgi:hypothetical protein